MFPTGDPNRYVKIITKFYDAKGKALHEEVETLRRTIIYRPIIIELSDKRLGPLVERTYSYKGEAFMEKVKFAIVEIEYHIINDCKKNRLVKKYGLPENTNTIYDFESINFTF